MVKPLLLDLFCGEGGAATGYMRAGFRVIGVDVVDHVRRYPGVFVQGDALEFLARHGRMFDAIHASPPCQGYSRATAGNPRARARHERLIHATRAVLTDVAPATPWVIENVEQARSELVDPILLCGRMFGLGAVDEDGMPLVLDRHRLFESNIDLQQPEHPKHGDEQVAGVYGGSRRSGKPHATPADDRYAARYERKGGYVPRSLRVQRDLLGIDWMTVKGMQESIPPVYAQRVGYVIRQHLAVFGAAA